MNAPCWQCRFGQLVKTVEVEEPSNNNNEYQEFPFPFPLWIQLRAELSELQARLIRNANSNSNIIFLIILPCFSHFSFLSSVIQHWMDWAWLASAGIIPSTRCWHAICWMCSVALILVLILNLILIRLFVLILACVRHSTPRHTQLTFALALPVTMADLLEGMRMRMRI